MKQYLVFCVLAFAQPVLAGGIDCNTLPEWSVVNQGLQVNQRHVYCGEPARGSSAKGFHAMPQGKAPNTYESSDKGEGPNGAGVYTLRNIRLKLDGHHYTKAFSSLFPAQCTLEQINASIVYSRQHSTGNCANPNWAQCGPNAPKGDRSGQYCQRSQGQTFQIASAVLPNDRRKINTGFPIYQP